MIKSFHLTACIIILNLITNLASYNYVILQGYRAPWLLSNRFNWDNMATEDDASNEKYYGDRKNQFLFTLKPDAHIPGYTGHCPYLRDTFGETFSTATWAAHIIRQNRFSIRPASAFPRLERTWKKDQLLELPPIHLTRSNDSLNNPGNGPLLNGLDKENLSLPHLVPAVKSKHSLDRLKQLYFWTQKNKCGNKDLTCSEPIAGYGGHVPRLHVTSTGLGLRFSEAVRLSLALFDREMETRRQWRSSIYTAPPSSPQTHLAPQD